MNYWLVTSEFPPNHGGGISTYAHATCKMLSENGHSVTVFVHDFGIRKTKVLYDGDIRIVRFLPNKTGSDRFLGYDAFLSYEFAAIIKEYLEAEGAPDILEAQEYAGIAYYIQQFKILCYPHFKDLNILITCHAPSFLYLDYNHVPVYKFPDYWTGQMEKASIVSADILISPSRYLVEEIKNKACTKGLEFNYVVNPISLENEFSKDRSIDVPDFVKGQIVCFGKLSPLKGTLQLLKYFDKLWKNGFELPLHIIGETNQFYHPDLCSMEDYVNKHYAHYRTKGLLILRGKLSPTEAKRELLNANVVLVPSLVDNLPYTVLEAMGLGKLVLASRQGGQSEIIDHGVDGLLFDHSISGDFEEKLQIALQFDVNRVNEIGTAAHHKINNCYNRETVYSQKIEVLESYLSSKQKRTLLPYTYTVSESQSLKVDSDLLSIVVPYYNMGDYIEDCVKSLVASDYKNKEIIIVNDGSNDKESLNKLSYIERNYPVKVYHKVNEGLSKARNFGAGVASGDFLAFLDADDTIEETYYSKAISVLTEYDNVHLVGCWTQYFGNSKDTWPTFNPEFPYLLAHNMLNTSALVYKKNSFLNSGLNDANLIYGMEDWESVINMLGSGYGGVILPEVLFNYRVRSDSMSRAFTRVKRLYLRKYIAQKHASLYGKYGAELNLMLNSNGSGLDFDNPTFNTSLNSHFYISKRLSNRVKEKVKTNRLLRPIAFKIYNYINRK